MAPAREQRPEVPAAAEAEEHQLVARLRSRDVEAFRVLVDLWNPSLLRVARTHVASHAVAEEVVQDTWIGVLRGIDAFEGRSSLRTWVFRILVNQAKTRGVREQRTVPFSSLEAEEASGTFSAVDPARFRPSTERAPGHWVSPPPRWECSPEASLESKETLAVIRAAVDALPPVQRLVIALRDVEGWEAPDVCDALEITEANQRVLLHRARARVRSALEGHLAP